MAYAVIPTVHEITNIQRWGKVGVPQVALLLIHGDMFKPLLAHFPCEGVIPDGNFGAFNVILGVQLGFPNFDVKIF